jgi:type I restriction enzyme S subunit
MKLPAQWHKVPLRQVAHVQTGLSKSENRSGPSVLRPYLRVANVQDGHLDLAAIKEIAVPASQVERFSLRTGDVLLTEGGDFDKLGRGSIWNGEISGCVHQNLVFAVRVIDRAVLLPEFLACEIQSSRAKNYFLSCAKQTTNLASINSSQLKELPILVPPLIEQRAIINASAAWDTAIQKAEQLIAAKERHRDALIQRLYLRSDSRGRPSRFADLLDESMEVGHNGLHAKKITVRLYGKGVFAKEEKRLGSEQTQYFVRRTGQLIYSKLDFLNGAFGIIPPELDGYESTLDLPAFDIAPTVNPVWLLGYLTRPIYYTRQVGLARGQRKARRVHPSDLLASGLKVPPRDLQDRIAEILTSSQGDIDKSQRLLEALRTQKRGLMQKLLTGQWRLPVSVPQPEHGNL